jgi:hypothetical protein
MLRNWLQLKKERYIIIAVGLKGQSGLFETDCVAFYRRSLRAEVFRL